jgi:hypothetical protein
MLKLGASDGFDEPFWWRLYERSEYDATVKVACLVRIGCVVWNRWAISSDGTNFVDTEP